MTTDYSKNRTLENLVLTAVRLSREIAEVLEELPILGICDASPNAIESLLSRLQAGEVSDVHVRTTLEAIQTYICSALLEEARGTLFEPVVVGYDGDGEICELRRVTVFTDHGKTLHNLRDKITNFLSVRQDLIDRANADRLFRYLLQ